MARRIVTLAVVLAVGAALAGTAPVSAAEDTSKEVDASTQVETGGDAEFCLEASGEEECVDLGRDVSGQLAASAVVSSSGDDPGIKVSVEGCPDNKAGAVIVFSRTGSGAEIEASFDGEATVDGDGHEVDEELGPVQVGGSGEASASVCASASAEVGTSGTSQEDSSSPLGGLLDRILP